MIHIKDGRGREVHRKKKEWKGRKIWIGDKRCVHKKEHHTCGLKYLQSLQRYVKNCMAIGLLSALTGRNFNFVSSARQLLENIIYTVAVWPGIQGPFFSLQFSLACFVEESRSTTSSFYILSVVIRILMFFCFKFYSTYIHFHYV